jgi:hypothetical protein
MNPEMRGAFLRELRDELAARRRTRTRGDADSPRGWRPAARVLALPAAALVALGALGVLTL